MVVACVDDTLLPDAVRVGGWLSVVGPGVAQPGWVAGFICADGSLRPEPPPMQQLAVLNSTQTCNGASRLLCAATTPDPVYVCTRWMYRTCQIP